SLLLHAPSTTYIHTLSLHDALPISARRRLTFYASILSDRNPRGPDRWRAMSPLIATTAAAGRLCPLSDIESDQRNADESSTKARDRKSTRLNSSHGSISYAVFCLKK